ncbi:MAG: hypothetical protein Q4A78_09990 [Peptostreptococcaceae bacterium]|nr:hypothetical protein [Peptostreptococcaceae bacterium]
MDLKDVSISELKSELESRRQEKRSIEFSKFMLLLILLSVFFVIVFSAYEMHRTLDLSALPTLITTVAGFGGVSAGFYSWKARAENLSKSQERIESMRMESIDTGGF